MKRSRISITLLAIPVAVLALAGDAPQANCQGEGPYELRQCGKSWFAPAPGGSGPVTTTWWAVGFGNATAFQSAINAGQDGGAFLPTPLPGVFIGNDSGTLDTADLGLISAQPFGGPAGSLCFGAIANWGSPGIDGCGDANRDAAGGGGAVSISNNYLNPYWDAAYGPGALYYAEQVDPPMGVLMTEGTGTTFALAFFANRTRDKDANDFSPGEYDVAALVNGDPSTTGNNAIPWQPVPQPSLASFCEAPACATLTLSVHWTPITIYSDASTRPCYFLDGVTPCTSFAPGVTGVGVLDQGPLARYQVERATWDGLACQTDWTPIPGGLVDHPASSMVLSGLVPPFCVRMTTFFGRKPASIVCDGPILTCRDFNRRAAQSGHLGDIGYQVSSRPMRPACLLGCDAENVTLTSATRGRGGVTVEWTTTSELNLTGFDIVALTARGRREVLAASVACSECTTGAAASYSVEIAQWKLRGAHSVKVVMRPSGVESQAMPVQ